MSTNLVGAYRLISVVASSSADKPEAGPLAWSVVPVHAS